MTNDILPADRRLRAVLIGVTLVVALLAIALFVFVLPNYLDSLKVLINERPTQGKAEFQTLIDTFILASMLCGTALVVYMAWTGRRALNAGQFPPPGARVLVDTRILSGDAAARRAKGMLWTAALLALLVLPGLLYLHVTLTDMLASLPVEGAPAASPVPRFNAD